MRGMTTPKLSYTDYYSAIGRARNNEWQRKWEIITCKLHNIKFCIERWESTHNSIGQYEVKLSRFCIGHSRLTRGHLTSRNVRKPMCSNANEKKTEQSLTIKNAARSAPIGDLAEKV